MYIPMHYVKLWGEMEVQLHSFLTCTLWCRWMVSFAPWLLYSQNRSPPCRCLGSCLGPRSSRELYRKEEYLACVRNRTV